MPDKVQALAFVLHILGPSVGRTESNLKFSHSVSLLPAVMRALSITPARRGSELRDRLSSSALQF